MPPLRPVIVRLLTLSFFISFCIVAFQFFFSGYGKDAIAFNAVEGVGTSVQIVERNAYHADRVPNGFFGGVSAGFFLNEEINAKPGLVSENVKIVRDTAELLSLDVLKFLNESNDRSTYLDLYIEQLVEQGNQVNDIKAKNKVVADDYKTNVNILRTELKATQKTYSTAVVQNLPDVAQEAFDQVQRLTSRIASLEETRDAYRKFDGLYSTALSTMQKRYTFLTMNREAIIKGVRVVDVKDTQIKLIFSQKEWEALAK